MDRRDFMKAGVTLAGGLVVDFALPLGPCPALAQAPSAAPFAPNAFIRIDRQNAVTLVMPMAEMGQGVYTAMAMLLAEELEVGLDQVRLEHAPADDALYANPLLQSQTVGNSTTIRGFWMPLRQAGAAARTMLIAAAAKRWSVDPSACQAQRGAVVHTASARRLAYGELVDAAATLPVPARDTVPLKRPEDMSLVGKPVKRFEGPDKVAGRTEFGIDVRLPGMKIAAIAISPVLGGHSTFVNEQAALAIAGVRQVVDIGEAVAVVADHMWAAKKGLKAAAIRWDDGPHANVDMRTIVGQLEQGSRQSGAVAKNEGDTQAALAGARQRVDAVYQMPFLAHGAMEPMNCTVHCTKDACEIWVGTQAPTRTQTMVAEATGLPTSAIKVYNHYLGGAFGRRLDADGSVLAVKIAQKVNGPVKVVWTREEDIQHDLYRPYYYDRMSAGLDADGHPIAWSHRIVGSSVVARYIPPLFKDGLEFDVIDCAADIPYACANRHVEYVRVEPPAVTTAFWRGVGLTHNVFVVESFIDELAHAAKQDPFQYRKAHTVHPRALAVLTLAADKAGWGKPLPARWGRGISLEFAFGSYASTVVELEVAPDGSVRVHRIVCAVDCGIAINPDTVAAQFEGGTLFGLTAALHGAITLKNGRVQQSNFHDYRPLRMNDSPKVETYLVKNAEFPGGIGETPTSAIAPAVTNAIFAATGVRIRTLPIDTALLKSPLSGTKDGQP
ncbi:MAG TPA: xanthine dehydrogenase family protein molybdopterin-binding subunit [Vicinamibacterales bacterium]|nr:xanthine dehydrogenase family protein molybdopterin-binding subunit [Vicinamibacterales bacterium]